MVDAAEAGRALYEARRTRVPIPPFTDAEPDLDAADGYAIQQELLALLLADGDEVAGYKLGLTSKAAQEMFGVDTPDYGPILASTIHTDGASVDAARFIQAKIEAEIVFELGDRLQGPGVGTADVLRATAGVAAALEIVDSRIEDWRIRLPDTIADLASNGAVVVADRVPITGFDVRLIGMVLERNGRMIDTGVGAAALGDPAAAVAWLANTLAPMGVALEPGHLIMTGSLHRFVDMHAGDVFRAEFDRLGSISVKVV
jgi:2-keto-4-pentenoate hydratase